MVYLQRETLGSGSPTTLSEGRLSCVKICSCSFSIIGYKSHGGSNYMLQTICNVSSSRCQPMHDCHTGPFHTSCNFSLFCFVPDFGELSMDFIWTSSWSVMKVCVNYVSGTLLNLGNASVFQGRKTWKRKRRNVFSGQHKSLPTLVVPVSLILWLLVKWSL